MESAMEWQANAIGDEISVVDQKDFPFNLYKEEEMQ
jgi:hypothetical protein